MLSSLQRRGLSDAGAMHEEEMAGLGPVPNWTAKELQAKLEQVRSHQRAAAEVLRVIAESPNRAQPVFDAIAKSAAELCGAAYCNIQLYDGNNLHVVATHNFPPDVLEEFMKLSPQPLDPNRNSGRAILTRTVSIVEDLWTAPNTSAPDLARRGNWRAHMAVPIFRRDETVDMIGVARPEPTVFS